MEIKTEILDEYTETVEKLLRRSNLLRYFVIGLLIVVAILVACGVSFVLK